MVCIIGVDHLPGRAPLEEGGAQAIQKQSNRRHIIHASALTQEGPDQANIQSRLRKIQSTQAVTASSDRVPAPFHARAIRAPVGIDL